MKTPDAPPVPPDPVLETYRPRFHGFASEDGRRWLLVPSGEPILPEERSTFLLDAGPEKLIRVDRQILHRSPCPPIVVESLNGTWYAKEVVVLGPSRFFMPDVDVVRFTTTEKIVLVAATPHAPRALGSAIAEGGIAGRYKC